MPLISESSSSSVTPTMAAPEADTLTCTASTTESSPPKLVPSPSTNFLSFSSKMTELSLSFPPSTILPSSTSSLAPTPDSLPSKSSFFCSTNLSSPIPSSNFDPSNTLSPP
ncbi:hypothetical protein TorRG33x02_343200 [Trema orientale]|uniref:Uncharacterized protein n=1 Tax=Trema orientale TaxID=63057 RepID=A0A2P5ARS5_TREOI|nr:hypothetical protein TorRG33x02_343200 [Trema orientale]